MNITIMLVDICWNSCRSSCKESFSFSLLFTKILTCRQILINLHTMTFHLKKNPLSFMLKDEPILVGAPPGCERAPKIWLLYVCPAADLIKNTQRYYDAYSALLSVYTITPMCKSNAVAFDVIRTPIYRYSLITRVKFNFPVFLLFPSLTFRNLASYI